ncbi:MAG: DUF2225 domain-containing protein [Brevinemataceae bacterium]
MQQKPSISFFSKKPIVCPNCDTNFYKEELQTGRGRINAGNITDELRRLYIPTQKYGIVNPLFYSIIVCPKCYFAGLLQEFQNKNLKFNSDLKDDHSNRNLLITKIFGSTLDFQKYRTPITGLASYLLGFASTAYFDKNSSPTVKRAVYAVRAAWLASDLFTQTKLQHFQDLSKEMYHQAFINYDSALDKQVKNTEPLDGMPWLGPDVDTNFGYDGLLYMTSYLTLKHLHLFTEQDQITKLSQIKIVLSKIFGVGKSNRDKPEILVSKSKDIYSTANKQLSQLAAKGFNIPVDAESTEEE